MRITSEVSTLARSTTYDSRRYAEISEKVKLMAHREEKLLSYFIENQTLYDGLSERSCALFKIDLGLNRFFYIFTGLVCSHHGVACKLKGTVRNYSDSCLHD